MITKAFKQPNSDTAEILTSDITRNYREEKQLTNGILYLQI